MCTWHDREDTQTCRGSGRGSGSWCASRPCRTACTCEGCSRLAPGQRSAACARLLNLQHQHKTSHFQLLASQHDLYDDEPPAAHSLCRRRLDRFSLSLSLFLSSHLYSLSLVLSVSVSPSSPFAPPPYLLLLILRLLRLSPFFSPHSSPLPLFYLFFFFFHYLPTNFPIRLPSYLRIKAVIVPRVYIYVYTRSLFPLFPSFRREVFLHASLFKATTFLLHPREARSFTRHPSSKCRAAVWRARERIEGRWWIDRCILAGPRTSFFFFFLRFEKGRCISRVQKKEKEIRIFFFFSPLMKIGWEFKRAHALTKRKKKYVSRI